MIKIAKRFNALHKMISDNFMSDIVELDISRDVYSTHLWACKIWEYLFRAVKGERAKSLHSFLCDLGYFKASMDVGLFKFYWEYDNGLTTTTIYHPGEGTVYLIEIVLGKTITITNVSEG